MSFEAGPFERRDTAGAARVVAGARALPVTDLPALESALADLASRPDHEALVVRDRSGSVLGCAVVHTFELPEDEPFRHLRPGRVAQAAAPSLGLSASGDREALEVADCLLREIDRAAGRLGAPTVMLTAPAPLAWLERPLIARGFLAGGAVAAARPRLAPPARAAAAPVAVRRALAGDEAAVVSLLGEEIAISAAHHPHFAHYWRPRAAAAFEASFRAALARSLNGPTPLVLVAVAGAEVVGAAWASVQRVSGPMSLLPPGAHAHLEHVGVRADRRGSGIGRALVAGVLDEFRALELAGSTLNFVVDNPFAGRAWSGLGFRTIATGFERREATA